MNQFDGNKFLEYRDRKNNFVQSIVKFYNDETIQMPARYLYDLIKEVDCDKIVQKQREENQMNMKQYKDQIGKHQKNEYSSIIVQTTTAVLSNENNDKLKDHLLKVEHRKLSQITADHESDRCSCIVM